MNRRVCERCPNITVKADERFCKQCKKAILSQLKGEGYLRYDTPKSVVRERLDRPSLDPRTQAELPPERDDV